MLLKATLHKLPDLERKLCSAYHKKVNRSGVSLINLATFFGVLIKLQSTVWSCI